MQDSVALEGEDARFRILLDAITDYAIYMVSPDGTISSWNAGANRLKGYSEAEIIGQNFSKFYTEADRAAGLPQRALQITARDGRVESEGWRVRKDGNRFWAHVVIDRIQDADGKLIGFAKVTRDLTERKRAETALITSEEQFRRLVEGVTDYAIYMLSPAGIVTNWNAGAERIKGYKRDDIVGEHFERFYTPEDRAKGEPGKALHIAERDGRYEREGWRVRSDGTHFLAHVVIDAIRDSDGRLLGYAKITRDITERAKAQRELEYAREQLFQSQKLEAIGQLTGGVAHDFNNLLMAVLGSLELARKRLPPDSEALRWIDNATEGAQRGVTVTQRLLAFARRQELEVKQTDIARLVSDMTELVQRSLGSQVSLETDIAPDLPLASTDPSQLETALLNLAVNARDAMPRGGKITIAASHLHHAAPLPAPPGEYICISVTDEGEGMSPDTLARATEPFFTTKGVGKGTGLGLSMVHGVAQQSGGALTVESEIGKGTTATIWLPVAPDQVLEAEPEAADPSPQGLHGLRILAVDDDALVLMNTAAMLEELGHQVVEAYSGTEAVQHLERQAFDLVITDHAMPRMTGAELAETIKSRWPQTRIILATGYAELPNGTDPGVPRLAKPFAIADLARVVQASAAAEAG
jgi:PAS domain S-box-containing protein